MNFSREYTRTPLPIGTIVEDKNKTQYEILEVAGEGGLAITYIAHTSGGYVALKELYPKAMENTAAKRDADGKIIFYDPYFPDRDTSEYKKKYIDAFRREATLTQKANALYNAAGEIADQNHPDAIKVHKSFQDKCTGNYFLVLDTYTGDTLKALIEHGWESSDAKETGQNTNLPEIIDVLKKVSLRLSNLHSDAQMFHLDLSPTNIYLTRQHGGTELHPYIIDYGSAYVYNRTRDHSHHHFTKNDFSAPEIVHLADPKNQPHGYSVTASSDTYSVCAMLFYAALGIKYSTEYCLSGEWQNSLKALYPSDIYESFAEQLIDFFNQGLEYREEFRYRTSDALYRALDTLAKALHGKGILAKMDQDILAAFLALDRYPLYDYADENKNIHVLCLGSGEIADTMVRTMVWCGQMLDYTLNIHIVSPTAEMYRDELFRKSPELKKYSDPDNSSEVYVKFSFEKMDVSSDEDMIKLSDRYGHCRYIVIALGANNINTDAARALAAKLAGKGLPEKYLIQYAQEDVAQNLLANAADSIHVKNIALRAFGSRLAENRRFANKLGMQAFRLHYLYDKLGQPTINRNNSMDNFLRGESAGYSQMSSAATALHMKYKLTSIGIHADTASGSTCVVDEYMKKVLGEDQSLFNKLLYLEHRRWMMYSIVMEGFRYPTMEQIDSYSFRNGNYRFRDNSRKYHPCLVPCNQDGIRLNSLSKQEWDQYESYGQIDATDFDALDKMSLKLHLLAGRKMVDAKPNINAALEMLQNLLRFFPDRTEKKAAQRTLQQFEKQLDDVIRGEILITEVPYQELSGCFEKVGVSIEGEIRQIKNSLRVVEEYYQYRDYKEPDRVIIEQLPWVFCAEDRIALIKLKNKE